MRRGGEEQRFTDGGTQPAMKSAEEALQMVVRVAQRRLPRVTVPLSDADLGKILAEDIYSPDPLPPSKVQACLQHPIKTDPVRPEFHCAIIRWNVNDGSRHPRFVAESTGNPLSSWLLSMKSANALLELSTTGSLIPAGTSVTAILISDLIPAAVDASAA